MKLSIADSVPRIPGQFSDKLLSSSVESVLADA